MKENKTLFRVEAKKKIWLSEAELEAFKLLAKQKVLSYDQMYRYISSKISIKQSSYYIKFFQSYLKTRMVVPIKIKKGLFGEKNFYRIGDNGVKVLKESGYLDPEFTPHQFATFSSRSYLDHFIATQEIVVHALDQSIREGLETECITNIDHSDLVNNQNDNVSNLKPDSILKLDDHFIHVELDTGTERLSKLQDKLTRYIQLANNNPDQQHSIVFSVIDDSYIVLQEQSDNRERRIKNIKEALFLAEGLYLENINVYVVALARTHKLVFNLLKGLKPYGERVVRNSIETVAHIFSNANDSFGYVFESVETSKLIPTDTDSFRFPDQCYKVNNRSGTNEHYVIFLFLEEANIKCLGRLDYLHGIRGHLKVNNCKLIGIYPDADEMNHDVFGHYQSLLIGDARSLSTTTTHAPTFYKKASVLRMGEASYEDI